MSHPQLVTAGVDLQLIIWVVVVASTLISQVVKAGRQKPHQMQPPDDDALPPPPRPAARIPLPHAEAQQELQDFLRNLAGAERHPVPPPFEVQETAPELPRPRMGPDREPAVVRAAKPDLPPPPTVLPRARHTVVEEGRRRVTEEELPDMPRPHHVRIQSTASLSSADTDPYAVIDLAADPKSTKSRLRTHLKADMKHRVGLRKALILKELLDAPLGMRVDSSHCPGDRLPV